MMMVNFIMGVVIGGLALWVFMREQVLLIEGQIADTTTKKRSQAASAPEVKTRKVGEGPKGSSKADKVDEPAEADEPSEPIADEASEPADEASEPADDAADESGSDDDESEDGDAADAASEEASDEAADDDNDADDGSDDDGAKKRKPSISLKLPEPSSATDDSEE